MPAKINKVTSEEQLDSVLDSSSAAPVVLVKHSNSCGISADVMEQISALEGEINQVVVQTHRKLSDDIEALTGLRHQSPQAFVFRDGKVVYHATHYGITLRDIEKALDENK